MGKREDIGGWPVASKPTVVTINGHAYPLTERCFLLLQGPPGPFFSKLARALEIEGAKTKRVVFCPGDAVDSKRQNFVRFRESQESWPDWIREFAKSNSVTDLVIYSDCRPYHAEAMAALSPLGVQVHVFEEGYLRPHYVTYERNGVNGNSRLTELPFSRIDRDRVETAMLEADREVGGVHWAYVWYCIRYYVPNAVGWMFYPNFRSHREVPLRVEVLTWLRRLLKSPSAKLRAERRAKRLMANPQKFHLALLQLRGDYQLREHSTLSTPREFIDHCVSAYAASKSSAPLVFKNHPLDPGWTDLENIIEDCARQRGVSGRVHYLDGGKLAPLLSNAMTVVAVNSTACHQSIMRGIPTKTLGTAVYNHPEFIDPAPLEVFFRDPKTPDVDAYAVFRRFLRLTTQANGQYYRGRGTQMLLDDVVDRMLCLSDTYDRYLKPPADLGQGEADATQRKIHSLMEAHSLHSDSRSTITYNPIGNRVGEREA